VKKDIKNGLVHRLVVGLIHGLVVGLFVGLVVGLIHGLVAGLVYGLVAGLVAGLVIGLVTQVVAYFTSNPLFSAFDLWGCLILLIIVQIVGWIMVYKLKGARPK